MSKQEHRCGPPEWTATGGRIGVRDRAGWRCPECFQEWQAIGWHPVEAQPEAHLSSCTCEDCQAKAGSNVTSVIGQHGPLRARLWFGVVHERPAVVGLELWGRRPVEAPWPVGVPELPETAVTSSNSRVNVHGVLAAHLAFQQALPRASRRLWDDLGDSEEPRVPRDEFEARIHAFEDRAGVPHSRHGRPPLSPDLLKHVARIEREAKARGVPTGREVARQMGKLLGRTVAESTARAWIRIAKNRLGPGLNEQQGERQ